MESHKELSPARVLVLCFDGTGNTFRADGTETNILKIFRMLDRSQDDQICYYQPGIGTEITPASLANTAFRRGKRLWTNKVIDLALGHSFDQHLIGGYRFLMRHYRSGCRIYIFGFSRGAYTARFLNQMLDYVGLLGPDNEEMIPFVWEAFATWKLSSPRETADRETAYQFLKVCRETVCRPVRRIHFLGLFDTVNSIAEFQVDTGGNPASKVIRHAVSIDERRIKFQPVLLQPGTVPRHRRSPHPPHPLADSAQPVVSQTSGLDDDDEETAPDLQEVWFPGGHADIGGGWKVSEREQWPLSHAPLVWMVQEAQRAGLRFDPDRLKQEQCCDELSGECSSIRAGEGREQSAPSSVFLDALRLSSTEGLLHDLLEFGQGLSPTSVLSWRVMEYLPLRRVRLQVDGSWKLIHWPPPFGGMRNIPVEALIHVSTIRRMQSDPNYRPGNLIVGGGGRGVRRAPRQWGIGEWVVYANESNPVLETYVRKANHPGQE